MNGEILPTGNLYIKKKKKNCILEVSIIYCREADEQIFCAANYFQFSDNSTV